MKTDLYNQEAKKIGDIDLPKELFGREWNPTLVHQAIQAQRSNNRVAIAHAKDRSEVSGGGRKPWRQKGTGRARHGSTRSPIWVGGGVTHGPTKERNFSVKLNKKMLRGALFSALSKKLTDGEIKIVENLTLAEPKTKTLAGVLSHFDKGKPNTLLVGTKGNTNLYRASRNIPNVKGMDSLSLNVYDLLRYKTILIDAQVVEGMKEHYGIV